MARGVGQQQKHPLHRHQHPQKPLQKRLHQAHQAKAKGMAGITAKEGMIVTTEMTTEMTMTDDLRSTLLAYFAIVPSACADMVASDLGIGQREIQDELIFMDDEGLLLMRNGFYRLSERARQYGK